MVLFKLDKNSKIPLFKQLINEIKEKIEIGTLKAGDKLPPTRELAAHLDVNRTTVYKAYQELWALGYIESKSGSYSYVRQKRECNSEVLLSENESICWKNKINPQAEKLFQQFGKIGHPFSGKTEKFDGIDFSLLHPDSRYFPAERFRKALNEVLTANPSDLFDYGESRGYLPLRNIISNRLTLHGINTNADEIIITNGAQNAIDLLIKLLVKPGDRVFVESPSYGMVFPTLTFYGCKIVPIPMTNEGADLNILQSELQKEAPAFFYTMPNFQNPTGITTNQEYREKLIALFEKFQVPIVEDAFEEEMKYFGKVPLPIKSMDKNKIVIYVGSFSKILFPGIRVGWIAASKECIDRLAVLKRCSDMSGNQPIQAALAEFCKEGFYELHIKKIHKVYRKRMMLAISNLQKLNRFENVEWIEPNGGFTMWIKLKNTPFSYDELNEIFLDNKIRLALGRDFFLSNSKERYFRLSVANLNEKEIYLGFNRLYKAIKEIYNL